jgi:hypothetical protein
VGASWWHHQLWSIQMAQPLQGLRNRNVTQGSSRRHDLRDNPGLSYETPLGFLLLPLPLILSINRNCWHVFTFGLMNSGARDEEHD